jgi:hypothetical protein
MKDMTMGNLDWVASDNSIDLGLVKVEADIVRTENVSGEESAETDSCTKSPKKGVMVASENREIKTFPISPEFQIPTNDTVDVADNLHIADNVETNKCQRCSKVFLCKKNLEGHILKKHPGEFICKICGWSMKDGDKTTISSHKKMCCRKTIEKPVIRDVISNSKTFEKPSKCLQDSPGSEGDESHDLLTDFTHDKQSDHSKLKIEALKDKSDCKAAYTANQHTEVETDAETQSCQQNLAESLLVVESESPIAVDHAVKIGNISVPVVGDMETDRYQLYPKVVLTKIDIKKMHSAEVICEICGWKSPSGIKRSLIGHRWKCHGKGKLRTKEDAPKCDQCSKIFSSRDTFRQHMKMIHLHEEVKCDLCPNTTFRNKYLMNIHNKNYHGGGNAKRRLRYEKDKEKFTIAYCDQCSKSFTTPWGLSGHKRRCHGGKPKLPKKTHPESKRTCSHCGKILATRHGLIKHLKDMHADSKTLKCPVCPRTFSARIRLNEHKQMHTGELDCPYCDKTFKWKHSLRDHIRAHNGVRPYKCSYCEADFIDNSALKKHTVKAHNIEVQGGICKKILQSTPFEVIKVAHRKKITI